MRKTLLVLLSSILSVFIITGCAEDTTTDNAGTGTGGGSAATPPTTVPLDPSNPDNITALSGNYEITFFYTAGDKIPSISSDCTLVDDYTGSLDSGCVSGTNDAQFKGYSSIAVDEALNVDIATKIQMTNTCLQNPNACSVGDEALWTAAKEKQYEYIKFTTIPSSEAIDKSGKLSSIDTAQGITGRTLTSTINSADATYSFGLLSDGSVSGSVTVTDVTEGFRTTFIVMKKIDALPSGYVVNANTKFPEPAIEGFLDTPTATTTLQ